MIDPQSGNIPLESKGSRNFSKARKSLGVPKTTPSLQGEISPRRLMDLLGLTQSSQKGKEIVRGELAHWVAPGIMTATLKAVGLDRTTGCRHRKGISSRASIRTRSLYRRGEASAFFHASWVVLGSFSRSLKRKGMPYKNPHGPGVLLNCTKTICSNFVWGLELQHQFSETFK